jgi:hypothetical protein
VKESLPLWRRQSTIAAVLVQPIKSNAGGDYHTLAGGGATNINTKLVILGSLGGLCDWICISAAIAAIYFLYGALANEAPVHYLLWSIGAGYLAKNLAITFKSSKEQVDYVDQLIKRGYTHAAATSAWEIANIGGSNLLLNLRQAERISENNQLTDHVDT